MLAPSLNGSNGLIRMHYHRYAQIKETWIWSIKEESRNRKAPIPCRIELLRMYAVLPLDLDNLYASCKIPLDALRSARVIPEDDPSCVAGLYCRQEKVAKKSQQGTLILLSEI